MGFTPGPVYMGRMHRRWGSLRGICFTIAALACGCSASKPPAYTRFPQTLIPAPSTVVSNTATPPTPNAAPGPQAPPLAVATPAAVPATPPPATTQPVNSDNEPWTPILAWCQARGLPAPEIQPGSRAIKIGGITHFLGFEPVALGGTVCIHPLDRVKTFEPLTQPPSWPNPKTVVLDPGHGGSQAGTRCLTGNRFEKEFTLDWALRLKPLLEQRGWTVHLTRTNDMDLPLSDRVRIADLHEAGLFISLHFNSSFPNTQARGLETYCLTPCGLTSTTTRVYTDDIAATYPNNQFDAANLILARRVHRHLLGATGATDRGIRRARFMDVLRGQNRPAVLIEGGFLSNPEESKAINSPAYRQRLAEGVARALE